MMTIIIFIIIILFLIITYAVYKRTKRKRAIKIIQVSAKKTVDEAMLTVEQNLQNQKIIKNVNHSLEGELVADVWGKMVLAFNYRIKLTKVAEISDIKSLINQDLSEYSANNNLKWNGQSALVVSDIWQKESLLNVDIAYIKNEETFEYLEDLKKV